MPQGPSHPGRRPRPVAGLPGLDPVAVAKGWLLELLTRRPLDDVASVPVALIARDAPDLCAAIAAAVADDGALAALVAGDGAPLAARAGALAGAVAPGDVVTAVDALRTVLHRALRTDADAALAADTGDRLAHVCAQVAALALAGHGPAPAGTTPGGDGPASSGAPVPAAVDPPAPWPPGTPSAAAAPAVSAGAPPAAAAAHVTALQAALAGTPGPVSVLAMELDGLERLLAVEGEDALVAALAPLEGALALAAGPEARLVREAPGRWWLVAPGRGTDAGRALAEELAAVVAELAPLRHGARLTVSMGIAVHPDDGHDAAALLAHADEGVFTARALGVPVA